MGIKKISIIRSTFLAIFLLVNISVVQPEAISIKKKNIKLAEKIKITEVFSINSSFNTIINPGWSPGSDKLTFQVIDKTTAQLFTGTSTGISMKIYSPEKKKLSPVLLFGHPYYPYWKPDGGGIAFIDNAENLDLVVKGGGNKILVTLDDIKNILGPDYAESKILLSEIQWSPAGNDISFQVSIKDAVNLNQLWVYDTVKEEISITGIDISTARHSYTWSGKNLIYISPAKNKKNPDKIILLTMPGQKTESLTDDSWMLWLKNGTPPNTIPPFYPGEQLPGIGGERTTPPRFSNLFSAKNIIYFINNYRGLRMNELVFKESKDLWCIDISSKKQKEIIRDIENYAVSKEGQIAVWKYDPEDKRSLMLIPSHELFPIPILNFEKGTILDLCWSPDGDKLVIILDDYKNAKVLLLDMPEIIE
ncbi:MAG: hypothetical protein J7M18_01515 [Candidatus Eremiobacteraeota bacterium]|nr:hypothetical protein [Candidatus Eremiobacteraeota bacterium]